MVNDAKSELSKGPVQTPNPSATVKSANKPEAIAKTAKQSMVTSQSNPGGEYEFDVCLSFAGEDRPFVSKVASCLKRHGIRYFYDNEKKADLWGKDLYTHLDEVYQDKSRYCIVFLSAHYKEKLWTNHERQSIQARSFKDLGEYLLPVRLDDTEIPGIRKTIGYLDGRKDSPSDIADLLKDKLNKATTLTPSKAKVSKATTSDTQTKGNKDEARKQPNKISTSGKWIMLGDKFYEAALVEESSDNQVTVQIKPKTPYDEANLRSLAVQPAWQSDDLPYAHGNDAAKCRVGNVQFTSRSGNIATTLTLTLTRLSTNNMDMAFNGMTVDEIAEKRARLILLDEKPSTGQAYQDSYIGRSPIQSQALECGTIAKRCKALGQNIAALQRARLSALYELKTNDVVEHIYDLTLGPVARGHIKVHFEGRRHVRYANEQGAMIKVDGYCPVG